MKERAGFNWKFLKIPFHSSHSPFGTAWRCSLHPRGSTFRRLSCQLPGGKRRTLHHGIMSVPQLGLVAFSPGMGQPESGDPKKNDDVACLECPTRKRRQIGIAFDVIWVPSFMPRITVARRCGGGWFLVSLRLRLTRFHGCQNCAQDWWMPENISGISRNPNPNTASPASSPYYHYRKFPNPLFEQMCGPHVFVISRKPISGFIRNFQRPAENIIYACFWHNTQRVQGNRSHNQLKK